jgi:preprotein translocase subunit SecA
MIFDFIGKFFDSNEAELKKLQPLVEKINSLEKTVVKLKDEEFPKKTEEFKERLASGESLDDLLPEAYALVREAAKRVISERHYDVQLLAGIALHQRKVAEQKTGEGKTLSATLPLYLNSLTGKGVHLVTVNDYLARRDAGWMGTIFNFLGVSTSAIISGKQFIFDPEYENKEAQDWRLRNLRPITRKEAYEADITYGINSEFGFDYLRDNMAVKAQDLVQKDFNFAVIDEVDSVLIDEARTPHIISAPDTEPTKKYYEYAKIVDRLRADLDFEIDEKARTANLTDHGISKVEKIIGVDNLFEKDFATLHHVEAALKARTLFKKDKEYIVKDGRVVIVDEFTGRLLEGRRFSEGIHQAIEAKEGVQIQRESKTLATVSLQNYFRMYKKLAGMTGTAATEAEEFHKIYKLDVIVIPTNKPLIRKDNPDLVYKAVRAKYAAVAKEVEEKYKKGQPVLVGTTSIEHNQIIANLLKHKGVKHNVLNAKNHALEAQIISEAGKKGAVTVATNMAGRGVDIILGGMKPDKYEYQKFVGDVSFKDNKEYKKKISDWQKAHQEVIKLGGLHVIGTERHESRRIDNQLRGRSGRQGDPGSSRFFVSLQDDIMRLFGGDQVAGLMTRFNLPEDQPLEHAIVSRAIEQAQKKVEGFNFDIRKRVVEFDDVLNKQREIIYGKRKKVLEVKTNTKQQILQMFKKEIEGISTLMAIDEGSQTKQVDKIIAEFAAIMPLNDREKDALRGQLEDLQAEEVNKLLFKFIEKEYEEREKEIGSSVVRDVERWVMLSVIDNLWMEHLDVITDLREGIGLRGYGQRDPLVEYKNEAFDLFEKLLRNIDYEIVRRVMRVEVKAQPQVDTMLTRAAQHARFQHEQLGQFEQPSQKQPSAVTARRLDTSKLGKAPGRNDPCPCGSGKKYKKCHYPNYG